MICVLVRNDHDDLLFWKGRKNQKPTTKDIRENILEFTEKFGVEERKKYVDGKYAEFINQE